jgi:hypothetical protein
MTKNLGLMVAKRFSRPELTDNIPLLGYILMMVEHMNGERIPRRKVRMDGGMLVVDNAFSRRQSLPSAYTYRLPRGQEESVTSKPFTSWKDFQKDKPKYGSFTMDGIYIKLLTISEPGFQLEGSGISSEEYGYLVQLKKRLAKHLGAVHPLFRSIPGRSKENSKSPSLPQLRSQNTPVKSSMKRDQEAPPPIFKKLPA